MRNRQIGGRFENSGDAPMENIHVCVSSTCDPDKVIMNTIHMPNVALEDYSDEPFRDCFTMKEGDWLITCRRWSTGNTIKLWISRVERENFAQNRCQTCMMANYNASGKWRGCQRKGYPCLDGCVYRYIAGRVYIHKESADLIARDIKNVMINIDNGITGSTDLFKNLDIK